MNLDKALRVLELHNIKPSIQRLAIMNYLLEHHTHPTVDDVYQGLHEELPTLSRTTVYNTLRMLSEHKAATLLNIDERRICYDGVTQPHAHFYCVKCGKVSDIMNVAIPKADGNVADGYRIEEAQLYYRGVCPECNVTTVED